ncbi:hypothetical protein KFE96_01270 [Kordiimonas sp. SCSIO 12603]|uniref:hypothetical protein n=1 Tax=Kordiimonas sp. SCSIO 12603 TaxID=2829596 RepID=UPI00210564D3|nr:hypothetical protein [Kordiimonas sp. SCSIO 12603]UTW58967.1 hypothetical protein KFE96_01270 [Kordiimonas sp. SCSIO 12603]
MSGNMLVHYEIQGRQGASWTILQICDDRETATKLGEKLWGAGKRFTGLRVLKESYNKSTQEFKSVEIFARGRAGKKSKYDQTGQITPCLSPDDLYSADGRRSIWLLMSTTLSDWRITPTELLHNLEHYNKLYNTGTLLQDAVQRTAVSFDVENESIQERMRKLYKVIDACVDIMKSTQANVPTLELGRLKPIISALEGASNKSFLLTCSLVEYLRPAVTPSDKFGRVSVFLSNTRPKWVTEILDQLLSELLLHNSVIDEILGSYENRADMMIDMAYLASGNLSIANSEGRTQKFPNEAKRLSGFIKEGMLPLTSHGLIERLKKEISASQPLSQHGLVHQVGCLRDLKRTAYTLLDNPHTLDTLREELNSRASRLINSHSIAELIASTDNPIEQIEALLDLETAAIGQSNKLTIANCIMPILSRPDYETIFMGLDGSGISRMGDLVNLQKKVLVAELTEMHRRQISEKLDGFCKVILDNTQLLQKLHKLDISLQDKSVKILQLMGDGYFTDGDCLMRAEQQVRTYMRQAGFTEGLISGLGREEAENKLIMFKTLLAKAGIKRLDPEDQVNLDSDSG